MGYLTKNWIRQNLPLPALRLIRKFRTGFTQTKTPYTNPARNKLHGYRCHGGTVKAIEPVAEIVTEELSDTVIQKPGFVTVDGQVFDLRKDGVYRFYRLPVVSEQRLVSTGDLDALLGQFGNLCGYGIQDGGLSGEGFLRKVSKRRVTSGCTDLAVFASTLLSAYGYDSRLVATMSQQDWGGQDDGHTLLEVSLGGNWAAYDPSFHLMFYHKDQPLSLLALTSADMQAVSFHRFAQPVFGKFQKDGYDYDFWQEERFLSEQALRAWYERVFDLPMIYNGRSFVYPTFRLESRGDERFNTCYEAMEENEFLNRFYRPQAQERKTGAAAT